MKTIAPLLAATALLLGACSSAPISPDGHAHSNAAAPAAKPPAADHAH